MHPIGLFTDFGVAGPYLGQVRGVLLEQAPGAPVLDLMADAPAFHPQAAAYLLAALVPEWPKSMVVVAVVDPGVGGDRLPLIIEVDGRWFVGPDNGLFEMLLRRADHWRCWAVTWRPSRLSASFHGRDLFAPVAARLAQGEPPERIGARRVEPFRPGDWPDDLAEVVYVDCYGNVMTGVRASQVADTTLVRVGASRLGRAGTFSDHPVGTPFWYENSIGLLEVVVNQGSASMVLKLDVGKKIALENV